MLTLTVLGCSGTYAEPGGACSGYLVEGGGASVWIDCGPGTLGNLQQHVGLPDLSALVVTHSHPDHWTELPVLRNALKYAFERVDFPVYGTVETRERAEAALGERLHPTISWTDIQAGSRVEIGGLTLTFSLTDHPVETLAVRVADTGAGTTVAYSADTGPAWDATDFSGVNLFLCEATLTPEFEGGPPHLSARQAGERARNIGAGRLVITHHWPGADVEAAKEQASAAYGDPVDAAAVHARYEVS